jgi:heme-degrading monooxygenase HmoA
MIARIWRGFATAGNAARYEDFVTTKVFPELRALPGHRSAFLLRRDLPEEAEFLAVTLWESRASIEAFAGRDIDVAVVEPEAQAALSRFDDFVRHYEVAFAAEQDACADVKGGKRP